MAKNMRFCQLVINSSVPTLPGVDSCMFHRCKKSYVNATFVLLLSSNGKLTFYKIWKI